MCTVVVDTSTSQPFFLPSGRQTKPPNAAHKRPCILGVLEDAVKVRVLCVRSKSHYAASCAVHTRSAMHTSGVRWLGDLP